MSESDKGAINYKTWGQKLKESMYNSRKLIDPVIWMKLLVYLFCWPIPCPQLSLPFQNELNDGLTLYIHIFWLLTRCALIRLFGEKDCSYITQMELEVTWQSRTQRCFGSISRCCHVYQVILESEESLLAAGVNQHLFSHVLRLTCQASRVEWNAVNINLGNKLP